MRDEAEYPDLVTVAALLRSADVRGSWPEGQRVRNLFVELMAELLERVGQRGLDNATQIGDMANRFYVVEENYLKGEQENLVKVIVSSEGDRDWHKFKDWPNLVTHAELNEVRHASVQFNKSFDKRSVWLPSWVLDAIKIYKQNEGFAGLKLRMFIKKMQFVTAKQEEALAKAEEVEDAKKYTYKSPKQLAALKKKRPKIVSKAKNGKAEYKPRTRDRKYI